MSCNQLITVNQRDFFFYLLCVAISVGSFYSWIVYIESIWDVIVDLVYVTRRRMKWNEKKRKEIAFWLIGWMNWFRSFVSLDTFIAITVCHHLLIGLDYQLISSFTPVGEKRKKKKRERKTCEKNCWFIFVYLVNSNLHVKCVYKLNTTCQLKIKYQMIVNYI